MKQINRKRHAKRSVGKVITGLVLGSLVGATVGWLTAPASGAEIRRRIKGEAFGPRGAQERAKTAAGNVESRARELAADVDRASNDVQESVTRQKKAIKTL